jgi:hypothetical protein
MTRVEYLYGGISFVEGRLGGEAFYEDFAGRCFRVTGASLKSFFALTKSVELQALLRIPGISCTEVVDDEPHEPRVGVK